MFLATAFKARVTYVAELARKGSRKINFSAMPADRPGGDVLVPLRSVPLDIRRAAREALL